jgi:hypothetical protein
VHFRSEEEGEQDSTSASISLISETRVGSHLNPLDCLNLASRRMSWKSLSHFNVHPLSAARKMVFTLISCMYGGDSRPSSHNPSKATGIPRPWHQQSRASPLTTEKSPISPVSPSSSYYALLSASLASINFGSTGDALSDWHETLVST